MVHPPQQEPPAADSPFQAATGVSRPKGLSGLARDAASLLAGYGFRAYAVALLVIAIDVLAGNLFSWAYRALGPLVGLHPT